MSHYSYRRGFAFLVVVIASLGCTKKGLRPGAPSFANTSQPQVSGESTFGPQDFSSFDEPVNFEQTAESGSIVDLFINLFAAEGEALNIAVRDLSLLIANNVKAINALSEREVSLGCATATIGLYSQEGSSERVGVPGSISDQSIFQVDPYNNAPLDVAPADSWGAVCINGWARTNCSVKRMGEHRNTPNGISSSLVLDADNYFSKNGCFGDNEEAYGLHPKIAITCCRNFDNN